MKLSSLLLAFLLFPLTLLAQGKFGPAFTSDNYFDKMEVGVSLGSTGIGVDVAAPVGSFVNVRAGFSFMPSFKYVSSFEVQVGDKKEKKFDEHGNRLVTKFDTLSQMLEGFTGFKVDDQIDMYCRPSYYNFRLVADVMPFANKHWHLSAGIYMGSRTIGRAYNTTEDMPSLLAVCLYNHMYDCAKDRKPIFSFGGQELALDYDKRQVFLRYGRMSIGVGEYKENHYYQEDVVDEWDDVIHAKGDIEHAEGSPYLMVPNEDGMVKVKLKANPIKPYIGGGYSGAISKDGKTSLTFDAGVLFWGGVPHVYTHEGVCLTHDVRNVKGKVGRYVSMVKGLPVFPVLELKVTRRIF